MSNVTDLLSKTSHQRVKKGETITQLAHRHLLDENHTTTDEELQNVRLELSENDTLADNVVQEVNNPKMFAPLHR